MDNAVLKRLKEAVDLNPGKLLLIVETADVAEIVAEVERLRGLLHAAVDMLPTGKAVELLKVSEDRNGQ